MQKKFIILLFGLAFLGLSCGTAKDGGVFKSIDGGLNWEQKTFIQKVKRKTYTISTVNVTAMTFAPQNPEMLFLGTKENGILKTDNGGENWQTTSINQGNISSIATDRQNENFLYASLDNLILKSIDQGQTWDIVYTQTGGNIVKIIADFYTPGKIYAATSLGTILQSTDYGNNWTILLQNDQSFLDLQMDNFDSRVLYALDKQNRIFKTLDSGANWQNISIEKDAPLKIKTDPTQANGLYILTKRGLLKSTDSGSSWQYITTVIPENSSLNEQIRNITIDPQNGRNLFFTIGRIIYKSTDAGLNWETIETFTSSRPISYLLINPTNSQTIYAGVEEIKKKKGFLRF